MARRYLLPRRHLVVSVRVTETDFDRNYREVALPELLVLADTLARLIAGGFLSFAEGEDLLMADAMRRGGAHLTDLFGLEEFLHGELADLTEAAFDRGA